MVRFSKGKNIKRTTKTLKIFDIIEQANVCIAGGPEEENGHRNNKNSMT
jgi:hypothetical protein